MMRKQWNLETSDGKTIYGIHDSADDKPNDKAILIIHGLTGTPKEVLHQAAANFFPAYGYDVIRPYLYCDQKNARRLKDCTYALHGQDAETVARHFAPHYKTLYAAGHSYGGPSILSSDTSLYRAICLWDPSFKRDPGLSPSFVKDEKKNRFVIEWEPHTEVGQGMIDESIAFDRATGITMAKNCKAPLRVIYAGDGNYIRLGESYHNHTKTQSDFKTVPGSQHCFDEPGTTKPLLDYTREWFNRFQP